MKIVAIILIAIGIALLFIQVYIQGDLAKEIASNTVPAANTGVSWYMYAGALSMAAGVFILMGRKKTGL